MLRQQIFSTDIRINRRKRTVLSPQEYRPVLILYNFNLKFNFIASTIDKIRLCGFFFFFTYRSGRDRCSRTRTSANSTARKLPTSRQFATWPRKSAERERRGGGRPCSYNIRKTSSAQWDWYILTRRTTGSNTVTKSTGGGRCSPADHGPNVSIYDCIDIWYLFGFDIVDVYDRRTPIEIPPTPVLYIYFTDFVTAREVL